MNPDPEQPQTPRTNAHYERIASIPRMEGDIETAGFIRQLERETAELRTALERIKNGDYDNAHSPRGAAEIARAALDVKGEA